MPRSALSYDIGEKDGLHYLVMEYLEGTPLRSQSGWTTLCLYRVHDRACSRERDIELAAAGLTRSLQQGVGGMVISLRARL